MEVLNEKPVSWIEAKRMLTAKEKDKELGYEQKNALDHLRKFCKLAESKYKSMDDELKEMEKLNERQRIAIMNFLPETQEELKLLFSSERTVLSEDDKKKIISTVKKHK